MSQGLRAPFRIFGIETNWTGLIVAGGLGAWVFVRLRKQKASLNSLLALGQGLILCVIVGYIVVFWGLSIRSDHIFAGDPRHYVPIYPLILVVLIDILRRVSWPSWGVILLLICYALSGIAALRETQSGILYNSPSYQTLTPLLSSRLQALPPETLIHTQDVGYVGYYAPDRPIRIFHILDAWNQGLACTDVIYPEGYKQAVFLTIDSPLVYDVSLEEVNKRWNDWATPCGTPMPVEQIGIARLMQLTLP